MGPMQRWELDREDPVTRTVLVQRAAEGERLKAICKSRGWPYAVVAQWLVADEDLAREVEAARRIWADDLATETVEIADAGGENVPNAKHRTDVRFRLAGFLDRGKWGEQVQHNVTIDPFGEMLRRVSERKLAALREAQVGPQEKVVNEVPALADADHELI